MGSQSFITKATGKSAADAFSNAVDHAQYMHGHGGYTGTIAEKHNFTMIVPPAGVAPRDYAVKLVFDCNPETDKEKKDYALVDDKWGAAGCIALGGDEYLFFGWASS